PLRCHPCQRVNDKAEQDGYGCPWELRGETRGPPHGLLHIAPIDTAADFPHHCHPFSIPLAMAVEVKFQFLAVDHNKGSVQLERMYVIVLSQIGWGHLSRQL